LIPLGLKSKFPPESIEWRISRCGTKKNGEFWAIAIAYITNRAIQNRLDEVFGEFFWKNEYVSWKSNSQLCGISIYNRDKGEWITKWDGADDSEFESTKGGLSDSMKRAAFQWGIGRYLYDLPENFVNCSEKKVTGWKYQSQSSKCNAFYWEIPKLPQWALPENENIPTLFNPPTTTPPTTTPPTTTPPTTPATTTNSQNNQTQNKEEKKNPPEHDYILDSNKKARFDKTTNRLNDAHQKQNDLIETPKWMELQALCMKWMGGNMNQLQKYIKGEYDVEFYDIKNDMLIEIIDTLNTNVNKIMDH